jgi:hypothetical protein
MSLSFLLLYTATIITHVASHGHNEVCGLNGIHLQSASYRRECLAELPFQQSLKSDHDMLEQHALDNISCRNSTMCDMSSGLNWTYSSPCIKGLLDAEEICVFTNPNFAQGRGISLLTTPARAKFIASQLAFINPDYVKDVNRDISQTIPAAAYKMKEIPGKGMGLEAIRYIKQGQLIMANTPSLMIDYRTFEWLPVKEYQMLQTVAIKYLPEAHQAAIMQLSTHDDVTDMSQEEIINKITSTNSFDITPDLEDPEQDYKLYTLFPDISRLNHDCRPNAGYLFDHKNMTHYIHALRDILPGEELTLSYTNPSVSRQERQDRLKRLWGFQCECDLCNQGKRQGAESDDRIAYINSLIPKFTDYPSPATPAMAELLINLYKKEGLWQNIYLPYTYAALKYNGIGELSMAVKYARMAIQHGLPLLGKEHSYIIDMVTLVNKPLEHWSWQMSLEGKAVTKFD